MTMPTTTLRCVLVVGVGAILGLFVRALMVWSTDCQGFGCLGTWMVAVAVGTVLVPLLGWAGLRLLGVPRAALSDVLGCLAGLALASGAVTLDAAARDLAPGSGVPSWWLLPVVGAVSAPAGAVVARAGIGWHVRAGVAVLVVLATAALLMTAGYVERRQETAEIVATGVDTYLPRIPGVEPTSAYTGDDDVRVTYYPADMTEWRRRVELHLVAAPADVTCEAVIDVGFLYDDGVTCSQSGSALVATDNRATCVAVVRVATMLVGCTDPAEMSLRDVSAALADAPPVKAEQLAGL
jgi:hypothetical protein